MASPTLDLDNSVATPSDSLLQPLFVLSVWRSGSSLLYTLLNQHSKIGLLYEADLPQLQCFLWSHFRSGAWRERWEFWNQAPSRHGIATESMPVHVSDAWEAARIVLPTGSTAQACHHLGGEDAACLPRRVADGRQLSGCAFYFSLARHDAVMESIARAALAERFFRKIAKRALLGNEKLREGCDALLDRGRAVHEVDYEDLVSNTSECMQRICEFLGVPFESQITSLDGADRSAICSGQHHATIRGNRIVDRRLRTETLSAATRAKISRYICRWKQRYGGKWPKYPVELSKGARPPGLVELGSDWILHQGQLCRDKLEALVYAVMPVNLARWLRRILRRRT